MADITISDGLLITATLLGPVLAVQAQKWIERARENREQKLRVFAQLMTTRATRLAGEHVQALNYIDLVFRKRWPAERAKNKAVREAWRLYSDKLNQGIAENETAVGIWASERDELFIDLLEAMSKALGFNDFDKVLLKRGAYSPKAHGDQESLLRNIQGGLAEMLSGKSPIAMRVVEFPVDAEMQKHMGAVLTGENTLKVKIDKDD